MHKESRILIIPRHLVTVRFVDIPSVEESEIENMVEFQAVKELPHPKEEMVISYKNLGSYKEGFSSIMLVIATKKMIQRSMREKDPEGIKAESIRLQTELLYSFLLKKDIVNPDKVNLVIHIGKEHSEIMIIDKNRLVFSRGFENSDRFFEEIDRSILLYKRDKANPEIDNIVVTSPSNIDIEDATPHIKAHFTIPVNFYEYSEDLASVDTPLEIDLLPKEISEKKSKIENRNQLFVTYILLGFIVVLFFAGLTFKIYEKKKVLGVFSSKIDHMQSEIDELDRFRKKTEIAKNHRKEGMFIIKILERSYNLIPKDITLSGLSYDGKKTISYKGTSRDTSAIFRFVKELERSKDFEGVEVKYATKKKVKGVEFTDFNIQCQFNASGR